MVYSITSLTANIVSYPQLTATLLLGRQCQHFIFIESYKGVGNSRIVDLNTPSFDILWMNFGSNFFLGSMTPKTPEKNLIAKVYPKVKWLGVQINDSRILISFADAFIQHLRLIRPTIDLLKLDNYLIDNCSANMWLKENCIHTTPPMLGLWGVFVKFYKKNKVSNLSKYTVILLCNGVKLIKWRQLNVAQHLGV